MARNPILTLFATFILAACAKTPPITAGPDPGDPSAAVPASTYSSVTAGTTAYRPVGPSPWIEQNEKVAPKPKAGE
jgi:hypothetical protein